MLVIPLCFMSALAFADSDAGTDLQNGGSGIYKDGHYMTFASAQIPIQQRPETVADIPGLKFLLNRISDLQLTSEIRNTLIKTTYPLKGRSYYRVDATHYDETLRQQILKNYLAIMAVPKNESIVLFAVTDVPSRTTFLLPEFYQLTEIEQAAILLHEAAWLMDPEQSYQNIVELELSAQAYFQHPQDPKAHSDFIKTSHNC